MANTYLKLFVDCLEKYEMLNDTEFGRLVRAALRYKATGEQTDHMGREALLWPGMRLDIDRDNKTYSDLVSARSEAGKKGALTRWQTNGKDGKCHLPHGKAWQTCQDKEEDKDKDEDDVLPGGSTARAGRFAPPTEEEVEKYCRERKNAVNPRRFVDFYAAKGWMMGKNPMRDWRAAVRTWEQRENPPQQDNGGLQGNPSAALIAHFMREEDG